MKKPTPISLFDHILPIALTLTIVAVMAATTPISGPWAFAVQDATRSLDSPDPHSSAPDLLQATIDRIEQLQSISAELQLDIYLFDKTYKGVGKYEELISRTENTGQNSAAENDSARVRRLSPLEWSRFRLHVKMLPDDAKGALPDTSETAENVLEIVCDLKALWTYTRIEGTENLTQLNIEDLANSLSRLNEEEKARLSRNGVDHPCGMSGLPGLGGIPGLLKQLLTCYDFETPPENTALDNGQFPVWKILGTLKEDKRESWRRNLLRDEPDKRRELLQTVPTHVELFIGKNRPFPYRIRYYSHWPDEQIAPKPICSINFNPYYENISSINPKSFIYGPPPLNYERINDRFLQQLIPGIEL